MNTFTINNYRAEAVRVDVTTEEAFYIFTEFCRTKDALFGSLVMYPDHILIDKKCFDRFIEFAKDLDIYFIWEDGSVDMKNIWNIDLISLQIHMARNIKMERNINIKAIEDNSRVAAGLEPEGTDVTLNPLEIYNE